MYDEGISLLQPYGNLPFNAAFLGYLYGKVGKVEEAKKILDDLLERTKKGYYLASLIAMVYAGLDDRDKVFEYLEKAYAVREGFLWGLKVDPTFAYLHSDPRWAEQMKKRGLAD